MLASAVDRKSGLATIIVGQKDLPNAFKEPLGSKLPNFNGPLLSLDSAVFLARFLAQLSLSYKEMRKMSANQSPLLKEEAPKKIKKSQVSPMKIPEKTADYSFTLNKISPNNQKGSS